MDVTPLVRKGQQIIQSYNQGVFKISGVIYDSAVLVTPDETLPWDARDFDGLSVDDFSVFIQKSDEIDVVLLGSGEEMKFLPLMLKTALAERGLQVDAMGTGAACRTYNVLMAEGRRVACALLPV